MQIPTKAKLTNGFLSSSVTHAGFKFSLKEAAIIGT